MGQPQYNINISNPHLYANDNFAKLITDSNRYVISYGGRDAGKSYNIAQKIIFHMLNERYCKVVLLRKIFCDIRDSQFQTILDVISDWGLDEYFTHTLHPLKICCHLNNNVIISRGLDKPTKLKSIKDPSIVWIEEANEIGYKDFMATDLSIRSNVQGALLQLILTFNPDDEKSWINQYFFPPTISYQKANEAFGFIQATKANTTILHSTYAENMYCSEQNKERYKNLKYIDTDYYNVAILGLWGSIDDSIIFKEFYEKDSFPNEEERKSHALGLDFGFTNDPSALVEGCIAHGEIYLRELIYNRGLVNISQSSDRMSLDAEFKKLNISHHEIFADSAEPKSIEELRLAGYNIRGIPKGKGSVEAGINSLQSYKINIVNSPHLKKELKNYKYKKNIDGEIARPPTPIDAFNHLIDATRYWYRGAVQEYKEVRLTML